MPEKPLDDLVARLRHESTARPRHESIARLRQDAAAELCQAEPAAGSGVIESWDLSIGVDGPGTRFVVFTCECPLRCLYCHNPETWRMRDGRRVTADEVTRWTATAGSSPSPAAG